MGNESRKRVADAWRGGRPCQGANVSTDGDSVYSYAHKAGHTEHKPIVAGTGAGGSWPPYVELPNAMGAIIKVAYDCHYSVTTAKHCSAFKAVADRVISCLECMGGGKS